MKIKSTIFIVFLSITSFFTHANSGLSGQKYLTLCTEYPDTENVCTISFGALKSGFEMGMLAYPAFVLNKTDNASLQKVYWCTKKSNKVNTGAEYQIFLDVLGTLSSDYLKNDLSFIYMQFLKHQYPLSDCN